MERRSRGIAEREREEGMLMLWECGSGWQLMNRRLAFVSIAEMVEFEVAERVRYWVSVVGDGKMEGWVCLVRIGL